MTLREMRRAADLTQTALASELGVTQAAVGSWERGAALPTVDKLPVMANALHCELEALVYAILEGGEPHERRIPPASPISQGGK